MKTIEELLKNLARPEVLEFGLVTNRLPSVNIGGRYEPVDDDAPSTERILQILTAVGGARHIEGLGDRPVQWTSRLEGVGQLTIAAIARSEVVQARITVTKREAAALPRTSVAPARAPTPRTGLVEEEDDKTSISPRLVPAPVPAVQRATVPIPNAGPRAAASDAPIQPQIIKPVGEPLASPRTPRAGQPRARRSEWDDDDEPTLQQALPPVPERPGHSVPAPVPPPPASITVPSLGAPVHRSSAQAPPAAVTAPPVAVTAPPAAVTAPPAAAIAVTAPAPFAVPPAPSTAPLLSTLTPPPVTLPAPARVPSAAPAVSPAKTSLSPAPNGVARRSTPPGPLAERDRPKVDAAAGIDTFFAMALAARASDLLIVAGRPALLRIATDLVPRTQAVTPEHVERIVREIVPARLRDVLERAGACDFAVEHATHGRFRVHAARHRGGWDLHFRVIPKEPPTLASLGLPAGIATSLRHTRGLVLVTSPPAHGKSTTLAALVDHVNREAARHILTVEAPIEHVHLRKKSLVSQRDVGLHVRDKARALAAALREDIDVLVVGDLGDVATLRQALLASESGRLVIGALDARSTSHALERIVELFPLDDQSWARARLASELRLVIGQRLVPSAERTRLYAAVEVLPWSTSLGVLLRDGRFPEIRELLRRGEDIVTLDESLAVLHRAHKITIDVARRYAENPAEIEPAAARVSASPGRI